MRTFIVSSLVLVLSIGCSSDPDPIAPDASPPPVTTVPRDPSGEFVIGTTLDLEPPHAAAMVVDALDRAASGPSQFILDRMVATLPDGATKTIARVAIPFVAAYLDVRLDEFAPRFVPGIHRLSTGFARIASHAQLLEVWNIAASGEAIRTIAGIQFDVGPAAVVAFADHGLSDVSVATRVVLDGSGQLAFAHHALALRYGALVRAGLGLAVVPTVDPASHDVAEALAALVDCTQLAAMVSDRIGVGSPLFYRGACIAAMTAVAAELDEHVIAIDAAPLVLDLTGAAIGVDLDHDGTMDAIRGGRWNGVATHTGAPQTVAATFAGTSPP